MAINLPPRGRIENGWPFVNYAQEERNFNSSPGAARSNSLSIPRMKFTYLVEFQINQRALANPITNISEFIQGNGKLYTHLRALDHPKPQMKMETLRSYNKWIKVPTTIEFPPAAMSFHDDSTAVVAALWKEHTHFYSHVATVGEDISGINSISRIDGNNEINSYQFTDTLTGEEMRSKMGQRPSLGMKLKANDMRHFFESIVIYDLGTEPDGVNVYWFHRPVITSWDHDNVDKEDRTGNVGISANFEYESYYFTVGQNRGRIKGFIETILGQFPSSDESIPRKNGIARDGRNVPADLAVELGTAAVGATSMFAGEDEIAAQSILAGSGFSETNTALADASREEQEASVMGLSAPSQAAKNAKDEAGYGDFDSDDFESAGIQGVPFGPEEESNLQEPLSPAQTANPLPRTIEGKQDELQRIDADQQRIRDEGLINDPTRDSPERSDALRRNAQLDNRREIVTDALNSQRRLQDDRDTRSSATRSALDNTKQKLGTADETRPINTTKISNPINQQKSDNLNVAADRSEQLSNRFEEIAEENRAVADDAAVRGDNRQANQATEQARKATLDSIKQQAQADFLREQADAIDPEIDLG